MKTPHIYLLAALALALTSCGLDPAFIERQHAKMSDDQIRTEHIVMESHPELWLGPRRALVREEYKRRGL